jgi:protein O-GlcNAc transferase
MADAEARFQEAVALVEAGRPGEADAICRDLLKALPDAPMVIFLRGLIASQLGDGARAVDLVAEAAQRDPANPSFQATLGAFLVDAGRGAEAVGPLQRAVALNGADMASLRHLGRQYLGQGRAREAADTFRRVTAGGGTQAADWVALGDAMDALQDTRAALDAFETALRLSPGDAGVLNRCGAARLKLGLLGDAMAAFESSLAARPADNPATVGLFAAKQLACDWNGFDLLAQQVDAQTGASVAADRVSVEDPFLHVTRCDDPARNLAVARLWSREIARRAAATGLRFEHAPRDRPVIHVGYLSSDFHDHATAHLMLGLFAAHDRARFSIHAYSCGPDDGSAYRRRIAVDCDSFTDLSGTDAGEGARKIHSDGIDILVDLKGFTRHHRLDIAALRPCPVQATWLGFPGTSGADFFDYLVTDDTVTPPADAAFYSEAFAVMPRCYQVNDGAQDVASEPATRAGAGLPEGAVVLASFNNTYKLESVMFAVWMDILKAVPGAVLWLLVNNRAAMDNLRLEATKAGVDAGRLFFADMMPKPRHLRRMGLADLVLDTRVYNGHTTTSDALWAGVPVLTLRGSHFASRVSASILTAFGLPGLVTHTLADYRARAIELANDHERLTALKRETAQLRNAAPLFDTKGFARDLERGYAEMWRRYRAGEPASRIDIAGL